MTALRPPRDESQRHKNWSPRWFVMLGLAGLLALVGGFGGWATFTELSGAVIATGRVQVEQNRQVVQHPDGGVVDSIAVSEGDFVEAGETLIVLDTALLRNRLEAAQAQLDELRARRARLVAERDDAEAVVFPPELVEKASRDAATRELLDGQQGLFAARRETIESSVEQLRIRREQIDRQIEGFDSQRSALREQVELIGEELESQQSLLDRGLAQASRVLELRREAARLEGQLGELLASAAEAAGRRSEIDSQILGLTVQRREDVISELRDTQFSEVEYRETVRSTAEQLERTAITAPVSGVVYDISVFGEQAVIRPAEPVLYLIPQDRPLVISAQVPPTDIDLVTPGQEVLIRLPTFDARSTPELAARVTGVSADAFLDEATGQTYYRAEIVLQPGEVDKLPEGLHLIPGMPVETYLRTADRAPIVYLTKPLTDYFTKAMREG
ncbi:HlyD family type I secretion periplasmic adaptor subunit [Palleronia sediminis]|uniref:Membrane fusion protein (MFP) family protein n=1 Tax=Palleronia sediminis TaxID=2547833 RepID=A0A4R6AD96_9RHOB|nr:HlyD family type I secretion periplasmic adaptor subunit [Palleronia sediminis]TDL79366.1 HlyD family type I secretion periplasmic adaptor subunit [Palleronia sediminis]